MNIYLDVDGVLLTRDGVPAQRVEDFLSRITSQHDCYWLTTHCKGNERTVLTTIMERFPQSAWTDLKRIKPTNWNTWKTEAIDFASDFRWIDDCVFKEERLTLRKHQVEDKLMLVNLDKNPEQLWEMVNDDPFLTMVYEEKR